MLKKYLSAFIALILIVCTVAGISVVTAYATVGMTAPDIYSTTVNVTGPDFIITEPPTEFDTSVGPVTSPVTRAELEQLARPSSFGHDVVDGAIFDTAEFDKARAYAEEVLDNPNATQDEINTAYYNLLAAKNNIKPKGYVAAPYLSGDYDGDNLVSIKDATSIQMVVARLYGFDQSYGYIGNCYMDVNSDFKINIKDVTMIQCYVAGYTDEASCGYTGQYRSPLYYYNNQYEIG